jgi:hypothetical protein
MDEFFFSSIYENYKRSLKIGHDLFIPHTSLLIIHNSHTIRHYIIYRTYQTSLNKQTSCDCEVLETHRAVLGPCCMYRFSTASNVANDFKSFIRADSVSMTSRGQEDTSAPDSS